MLKCFDYVVAQEYESHICNLNWKKISAQSSLVALEIYLFLVKFNFTDQFKFHILNKIETHLNPKDLSIPSLHEQVITNNSQ